MRILRYFFLLLLPLFLFASAKEIDKKIKTTSSKLQHYSKNYENLNKKMAQTAKAILRQKRELQKQEAYLQKLEKELKAKADVFATNKKELQEIKKEQQKLNEKQTQLEEALVFVLAKGVSLAIMLDDEYPKSQEGLMEFEVLKKMLAKSKKEAKELGKDFVKNATYIERLNAKVSQLEAAIKEIEQKKKELTKKQRENKKALVKLQKDKSAYKKELKALLKRQNALKQTLSRLNLIKIDRLKKEQQERERKAAFERKKMVSNENLPKIKRHGSSYQSIKTIRYRGPKTIAPLNSYTITKKYGTYTDPIYGIKIFNESISLKPKKANAKVKNVFNGKVIYADKTAVLKNIVIVEHKNGLHTIYANLSKIAPNIKKGKKVKKGAIIGRVRDELIFEVTQKSAHINPIRLFR